MKEYSNTTILLNSKTKFKCPVCNTGILYSDEKLIKKEGYEKYNKEVYEHEDSEPDWYKYSFAGFLLCQNNECGEKICYAGKLTNNIFDAEVGYDEYETIEEIYLKIEYIERSPHIIPIKTKYPKEINEILEISFSLFWIDENSCANKIRILIEELMDYFSIQKISRTKGKQTVLTLHSRIEKFKKISSEVSEFLMAIKWIGNFASHKKKIGRDDLIDSYRIIRLSLDKLFDDEESEIRKIAKEITKRRKPRSK
jgi:hypothetical protein